MWLSRRSTAQPEKADDAAAKSDPTAALSTSHGQQLNPTGDCAADTHSRGNLSNGRARTERRIGSKRRRRKMVSAKTHHSCTSRQLGVVESIHCWCSIYTTFRTGEYSGLAVDGTTAYPVSRDLASTGFSAVSSTGGVVTIAHS